MYKVFFNQKPIFLTTELVPQTDRTPVLFIKFSSPENIIKALKNRSACLIANHGQVAFGDNLEKAFELAEEIENICHQYINALRIGIPKILSKKEMKIVLGKMKNYKRS